MPDTPPRDHLRLLPVGASPTPDTPEMRRTDMAGYVSWLRIYADELEAAFPPDVRVNSVVVHDIGGQARYGEYNSASTVSMGLLALGSAMIADNMRD